MSDEDKMIKFVSSLEVYREVKFVEITAFPSS